MNRKTFFWFVGRNFYLLLFLFFLAVFSVFMLFFNCRTSLEEIVRTEDVVGCAYGCTPIFKDNNIETGDIVDCNGEPLYEFMHGRCRLGKVSARIKHVSCSIGGSKDIYISLNT